MANDTKKLIADSLTSLLEHKQLDRITVKYLVEYCGISRQTFYYHFQDIMDVLEWGAGQTVEQMLKESLNASNARDAINIFITHAIQKKEVSRRLLESSRRAEYETVIAKAIRTYLQELFRQKYTNPQITISDINLLLDFYSFGLVGILLKYCSAENVDKTLLTEQIYRLISGEMLKKLANL